MYQRFFSFVIPAHNEELIIERTLRCMEFLDYPKDRYEVIVVENGSTDKTYALAAPFASETFKIFSIKEKGVSRARNFGKAKCSPDLDWCIFIDADVFLGEGFLTELNTYLEAHPHAGYGSTTVLLDSDRAVAKFWSLFNNFFFELFKVLYTIHIVRKDLLPQVAHDENLVSGEDIQYGRDLSKLGTYFFMKTKLLVTSARRFEKKGYLTMFFINLYSGVACYILPEKLHRKVDWEVIR